MCSCHSIPECCVMFSGVKLSMGLFVLLHITIFKITVSCQLLCFGYFLQYPCSNLYTCINFHKHLMESRWGNIHFATYFREPVNCYTADQLQMIQGNGV